MYNKIKSVFDEVSMTFSSSKVPNDGVPAPNTIEKEYSLKKTSGFQTGRLLSGHIVKEKDYSSLAKQQVEKKMISEMGATRFASRIKTHRGKKEFETAVSKKVSELKETDKKLTKPPLNNNARTPSKIVIGSKSEDHTSTVAFERMSSDKRAQKSPSKTLTQRTESSKPQEKSPPVPHEVNVILHAGQAPYSLKEMIMKANVECTKALRSIGKTATAPIKLVGLNENVQPRNKVEKEEVHYVGIFKFASEGELFLKRKIEKAVKGTTVAIKLLGMRRPTTLLPGKRVEAKAFGEKFCYDFSKKFGFKVVPETNFTYIDNKGNLSEADRPDLDPEKKLGTVQVFAKQGEEGFKDARVHIKENKKTQATPHGLTQYQKCAILSYIMGGIDCHLGNVLSQIKDGKYTDFTLIDNGNSFFEEFPDENDKLILANYCAWAEHPLSELDLDPDVKAYIQELNPENIVGFMLECRERMAGFCMVTDKNGKLVDMANIYFNEKMIKNTLLRLEVVKKVISDESKTLQDLAQIKTANQTKEFLTENVWNRINATSILPSKVELPELR